jgi:Gas vesicle protein
MAGDSLVQPGGGYGPQHGGPQSANLADILERVLDKGLVIAGDIRVNLLDIELLTIKLRLVIASVQTARELGIDWWEHDPWLSGNDSDRRQLEEENRRLRDRLAAIEGEDAGDRRAVEAPREREGRRSERR